MPVFFRRHDVKIVKLKLLLQNEKWQKKSKPHHIFTTSRLQHYKLSDGCIHYLVTLQDFTGVPIFDDLFYPCFTEMYGSQYKINLYSHVKHREFWDDMLLLQLRKFLMETMLHLKIVIFKCISGYKGKSFRA